MSPFAISTRNRILIALDLPAVELPGAVLHGGTSNWADRVQRAMDQAFTVGGDDMVIRIENLLDQYEAAETSFNAGASGAGLIKADVLEWAPGQRQTGFKTEMNRLRNKLISLLALQDVAGGGRRVRVVRG